jgi:DNA mismatch repair ATPase MutS
MIYDIERLQRKIAIKSIDPMDLKKWINSIQTILNLKKYTQNLNY